MLAESDTQTSPFTTGDTQKTLFTYLGISAAVFLVIALGFDIARRMYKMQKQKVQKVNTVGEP